MKQDNSNKIILNKGTKIVQRTWLKKLSLYCESKMDENLSMQGPIFTKNPS